MTAHSAQLSAQLQRAGPHQVLPATSSFALSGQRAARVAGSRLCRQASPLSRLLRAQRSPSSAPAVTASTYENGYGSVGKPEEQAAPLSVDIASLQTVRNPPAAHPLAHAPAAVQGAAASPPASDCNWMSLAHAPLGNAAMHVYALHIMTVLESHALKTNVMPGRW